MEVHNKEMYHYHRGSRYDNVWQVGKEIIVDDTLYSYFCTILQDFHTSVICKNDELVAFDSVIERCLNEGLENQNLKYAAKVAEKARKLILHMGIYNRELALERYRLEHCPELPSRLHSFWFCDANGLDHWKKQLGENCKLKLFRVALDGELFCSSDYWLPSRKLCVDQMYQEASLYWNPPYTEAEDREYLFQGKVKVLEQLRIDDKK